MCEVLASGAGTRVPVSQWVLSFPWPLCLPFAARPQLLTRVLAVVSRALSTALAHRAGLRASSAEIGLVTLIPMARDPDGEAALTQLEEAAARHRIAGGAIAGRKTLRLHTPGVALEGHSRLYRRTRMKSPPPATRAWLGKEVVYPCDSQF